MYDFRIDLRTLSIYKSQLLHSNRYAYLPLEFVQCDWCPQVHNCVGSSFLQICPFRKFCAEYKGVNP